MEIDLKFISQMKIAADELIKLANDLAIDDHLTVDEMKRKFLDTTEAMLRKDIEDNKAIGTNGAEAILKNVDGMVRILTHCKWVPLLSNYCHNCIIF